MSGEKEKVALSSVGAAVFLTIVKIAVGILTGSLGIVSEAAHSAMDLGAAVVTFFAVRISDKPADSDHNYGHGKVESFSALIETLLLLATCGWIIYEAVERLFLGKSIEVSGTFWGISVMLLSIIINISRSRALKKVAEKHGSQALEADALHFDSDVWSSIVVMVGLMCVWAGNYFGIPILKYGDPVAALGVSVLIMIVSFKLGKRTIDVLLDKAPNGMDDMVLKEVNQVKGVLDISKVRSRSVGADNFIELLVGIDKNESHRVVHSIVDEIRERINTVIPNSDVVVSTYPVDNESKSDRGIYYDVKKIVDKFPNCTNIHNIHVYEVSGKSNIAVHIEVRESMSLQMSHDLSHKIEGMIKSSINDVNDVNVHFEHVQQEYICADDITITSKDIVNKVSSLINKTPNRLNCHDIKVYSRQGNYILFLHCEFSKDFKTEKAEVITKGIVKVIRKNINNIESVHVHLEPMK